MGFSTSCDDFKFWNEFLEKPISNDMNIDSVFTKKMYAEQHLAQVYHSLPDHTPINGRLDWAALECLTDLADNTKTAGTRYHTGEITSVDPQRFPYALMYNNKKDGKFSSIYGIRQAYIFLENVDRVADMTPEEKRVRKGEAKLIIAYHYVDWLRNLGGMPWIDGSYKPDDDMKMTRMTIAEMVQKIETLCDEAAALLPWDIKAEDAGRMTKAGALALKSRMWTFAASPLFNDNQPFRAGEASDNHYTWWGNYDKQRWQKALDAGLAFIEENRKNGNAYELVDNGDPRSSFTSGYFDRYNHEALITSHRYVTWNLNSYNVTQVKYGACNPLLNYADMFPMRDGSDFSWDNPEHKRYPFFKYDAENKKLIETRDPRLYETLIVTNDKFWGRKAEIYKGGREQPKDMGGGQNWRWADLGHNGIAQRKYLQDHNNELKNKFYQCCLLRLPEIYLNIAEAMNELGIATQKDKYGRDAYDYINLLRERVDMPGITREKAAPGTALREAILRERALEFGYEEVRYFDIARWKRKDLLKVKRARLRTTPIGKKQPVGKKTYFVEFDHKIDYKMVNQRIWVDQWDDRYYLSPIALEEINKKYGLVQNPGW